MNKWLNIFGVVLLVLVVILVIGYVAIYASNEARLNKVYSIPATTLTVPTDEASVTAGQHIAIIRGCVGCHEQNLAGGIVFSSPVIGTVASINLTKGQGGVGGKLTDADWERAIRHGVDPDGKPLLLMPADAFYVMTDEDTANLIAYLKTLTPVDNNQPDSTLGPLGRVLMAAGAFPILSVEVIDHTAPHADPSVTKGVSVEHGKYLATTCIGCHGASYAGKPGNDPSVPPARNLTPAGDLAKWSVTDFMNFMRSGTTPAGEHIDPRFMPWPPYGQMTDDELKSVFMFLQSLPPKSTGSN